MTKPLFTLLILICLFISVLARPSWAAGESKPSPDSPVEAASEADTADDLQKRPSVDELIQQLGSPEFLTRRRAEKALERLGFDAFDALKEAEQNPDIEIATAARYLAGRIKVDWTRENDSKEVKQLLGNYEGLTEEQREQRAEMMLRLPNDAGFVPLCRVIRFESSARLSKLAALLALNTSTAEEATWEARAKVIEEELGTSQRAPADWLRSQVEYVRNPDRRDEVLKDWEKYTLAERQILKTNSADTSRKVISGVLRHRATLLRQMDRKDEAKVLLVEIISLEDGDLESLLQLVSWLSDDEQWDLIDQVAKRFAKQFESEPVLLYTLAELKLKQNQKEEADKYAQKAIDLSGENAQLHLQMAFNLQDRGLFRWAEHEYKEVIRIDNVAGRWRVLATYRLAEMLHDQMRELEAGTVLKEMTNQMKKEPRVRATVEAFNLEPNALQSRAEYFLACDEEQKKNYAEQRKHLEQAITHDPTDADVLIAMYRFAKSDEEFRKKTLDLIEEAASTFKQDIDTSPDSAQGYNQYAWLISNTEGDYDEALKFSHHSLELSPDRAGYLDTLGRCYYAKGDLENAIKYQSKAVELEPHSLVIGRQLEFFRSELAKQQNEGDAKPAPQTKPAAEPKDSPNPSSEEEE